MHLGASGSIIALLGLAPRATAGLKLQEMCPTDYRVLAAPLLLFRFDWAETPVNEICRPRNVTLPLRISSTGTLTAFLIYFHLHLDHGPVSKKRILPSSLDDMIGAA